THDVGGSSTQRLHRAVRHLTGPAATRRSAPARTQGAQASGRDDAAGVVADAGIGEFARSLGLRAIPLGRPNARPALESIVSPVVLVARRCFGLGWAQRLGHFRRPGKLEHPWEFRKPRQLRNRRLTKNWFLAKLPS